MSKATPIPKNKRDLIALHRESPSLLPQAEAMRRLRLGKDYHAFYRLFYRATMHQTVRKDE